MNDPHFQTKPLNEKHKAILLGVAQILIFLPKEWDQNSLDERFWNRTQSLIHVMPVLQRFFLKCALLFFDLLPFFWGYGPQFFCDLTFEKKKTYFERWISSSFLTFREIAKAIRGLVLVVYMSDEEIWRYMDFDPLTHIQERRQWREKLIREKTS